MSETVLERRIVTILFADLVGFTSLAERLDAEDVATVQDAYFGLVRETVARHGGQLEKFIGDAAMAVFGLVRARDDDAERAVRAGLALANGVEALGGRLGLEVAELRVRVGINTGEVVAAEQGPDRGRVTGDTVNTAARLQAAAPPGRVLLGELTALAVAEAIELEPAAALELKGKAEPVRASLAAAVRLERSREEAMGGLRAPLLGRGPELDRLARIADRVAAGAIERVLLVAPPGVGKTRLVEEFVARGSGLRILRARLRPDAGSPFEAVVELAHGALGDGPPVLAERLVERLVARGEGEARARAIASDVTALVAGWNALGVEGRSGGSDGPAERVGPLAPAEPATSADRTAAFDAWTAALDAAADGPACWLIEDLHWAGSDLLAFLDAAQLRPHAAGRLILATARPSILERLQPETEERGAHDPRLPWASLDLPVLVADETRALVRALVGPALPAELVDRIAERSDGNCLFVEELLRTWIAVGTLMPGALPGTWMLAVPVDDAPLPATVQAVYAGQVDDLPSGPRTAARRASVAGRRFPEAALSALGIDDVRGSLDNLRRRAFIAGPVAAALTGDEYAYRHALLRDAAYASLARTERARLHVRLARWLEANAGPHADELAEAIAAHYESAVASASVLATDVADGLDRRSAARLAAAWLERAGDRALRAFANAAARSAFERSVRMTPDDDRLDAARRWRRLGEATTRDGDVDEAAAAYSTSSAGFLAVLEDGSASDEQHAVARRGLASAAAAESGARYEQIRFVEARQIAEAALERTGADDPLAAVPLLLARLWGILGTTNEITAVVEEAAKALEIAETTGDRELIFAAREAVLGFGHDAGSTTPDDWLAFAADARSLGRWSEAARATINAAGLASDRDPARARELVDEAELVAEARGLTELLAWIGLTRAETGLVDGDWSAARRAGLRTIDLAERHRYHRAAVRTWFVTTEIAGSTADLELLERAGLWFEEHRGIFPGSPYGLVNHAAVDLRLAASGLGEPPALDPTTLLPGFGFGDTSPGFLCAIERIVAAWLERGQMDVAGEATERCCGADLGTLADIAPLTAASRTLVRAWVTRSRDRADEAADLFSQAVAAARRAAAPWWISRAIRGLESVGRATTDELAEAAALERDLGVVRGPTFIRGRSGPT